MIQPTFSVSEPSEFVERYLRGDPSATYDQVRRAASAEGLTIFPSLFGAIRKQVRGELKAAEAAATEAAATETMAAPSADHQSPSEDPFPDRFGSGPSWVPRAPFPREPRVRESDPNGSMDRGRGSRQRAGGPVFDDLAIGRASPRSDFFDELQPPRHAPKSGVFQPLPGRVPKSTGLSAGQPSGATGPAAMLEDFVARVRALEAQTLRYEGAIDAIRDLVVATLTGLDED